MAARPGAGEEETGMLLASAGQVRPMKEVQREYAAKVLELHDGNWTQAAKALGIAKNTLRKLLNP